MKLLDVLQGKWLGHPLHPALVHVPLGLWPFALILDLLVRFGWGPLLLSHLAFYAVVMGLAVALLAVPPGIADWKPIKKEKPAWKLGVYHLVLNLGAAAVWTANVLLRYPPLNGPEPVTGAVLGTSVLGTALVFIGGYLGSLMVFEHGTSVARQSKQKWRSVAVSGGSRVPKEK